MLGPHCRGSLGRVLDTDYCCASDCCTPVPRWHAREPVEKLGLSTWCVLPLLPAAVTCTTAPTVPSNAVWSCQATAFGGTCTGRCATGFSGTPVATCGASGASGAWTVTGTCSAGGVVILALCVLVHVHVFVQETRRSGMGSVLRGSTLFLTGTSCRGGAEVNVWMLLVDAAVHLQLPTN